MRRRFWQPALVAVLILFAGAGIPAQAPAPVHDDLLDHMVGNWMLEGTMVGAPAHHTVQAEWILNHQFLRLIEKTSASAPAKESKYEAHWFIGYDAVKKKYVAHLIDMFGASYSETLGYGTRDGDSIKFIYDYPDGPFHTTYEWLPQEHAWHWLLEQKGKSGKWSTFADLKMARAKLPATR